MTGSFTFRVAGEIQFGAGSITRLGELIRNFGRRRVFLVVDPGFSKTGALSKITESIRSAGMEWVLFDEVEPEPRLETADRCGEEARKAQCDFVVGVGGGSAMDTAKAAAILVTNGGKARDYLGLNKVPKAGLPKGMVPTTAGTGSEVTFTAVFINEGEKKKAGINSPFLYPEISILDPELTFGLPPAVTASTGMDALTHAIESYTSKAASPVSEMHSEEAIRRIGRSLRRAVENGSDGSARSDMLLGSLLGGIGLANAGVTAAHSLAYPLGGMFRVPHGVANAMLLPPVMAYNAAFAPEKFAKIAQWLGEKVDGLSVKEAALRAVEAVSKLAQDVEIPRRLSDLGIPASTISQMAEEALKVLRPLENNARPLGLHDAIQLYQSIF